MNLQVKMFAEVEAWRASGTPKSEFLKFKEYSAAKFNYWIAKWKAGQSEPHKEGFVEFGVSALKLEKVLEIEAPSGIRITVFA